MLRDVSEIVNGDSGKVAHEIVGDGSVYYGALSSAGNTDETAKFPSLVALIWRWTGDDAFRDDLYPFAVRNMHYVVEQLDADGDGWPEGLGNVERTGMGEEKLDNTVYTIRGLFDLADLAKAKRDTATARWARQHARDLASRFEDAWWFGGADNQYADSLDDPGNVKTFQKHWIGVTPMEAELTRDGKAAPGLASLAHGTAALAGRESDCYSGTRPVQPRPVPHRPAAAAPTARASGRSSAQNTAIQAVGEGNYGRLAQQKRYTDAEVEPMFGEPYSGGDEVHHTAGTPDEQPGASPEIFPSPDFDAAGVRDANVERCTRCRSMVMQAWNQYGTMWPVVHQQLGVRPDLGRGRLTVVPQLPSSAPIAGSDIRLGNGRLDQVNVWRDGRRYGTSVEGLARARQAPGDRPDAAARREHQVRHARRAAPRLARPDDQPRARGHRGHAPGSARGGDHRGAEAVPGVLEGPPRADRPGLHAVGERHRLDRAVAGDRVQLGSAAEPVERVQHPGADALGLGGPAGAAQAAPAQPRVERPHRAAVVGVRLEHR